MALIPMPTQPGVALSRWMADTVTGFGSSGYTFAASAQSWTHGRQRVSLSIAPATREELEDWRAFVHLLKGSVNTFSWSDPTRTVRGEAPSGCTVSGFKEVGRVLTVSGFTANRARAVRLGDLFSVGGRVFCCTQDTDADGSGRCAIPVWPDLPGRISPPIECTFQDEDVESAGDDFGAAVDDVAILSTEGELPGEFTAGTAYYVVSMPSADSITLGESKGDDPIITTGAGSGRHYLQIRGGAFEPLDAVTWGPAAVWRLVPPYPDFDIGPDHFARTINLNAVEAISP